MKDLRFYLPGAALILLAVLILAVPEILTVMVASIMMMIGLGALYMGHAIRKPDADRSGSDRWFQDNIRFSRGYVKQPSVRWRWYRYR